MNYNNAKTGLFYEGSFSCSSLALLIHDIPQRIHIVESFSTTTKQSYYILLSDFQTRQNEA